MMLVCIRMLQWWQKTYIIVMKVEEKYKEIRYKTVYNKKYEINIWCIQKNRSGQSGFCLSLSAYLWQTISVRRFFARPAAVSFVATKFVAPYPLVSMREAQMPSDTK